MNRLTASIFTLALLAGCASPSTPSPTSSAAAREDAESRHVGLRIKETEHGLLVLALDCAAPAYNDGNIHRGDLITIANGESMKGLGGKGSGPARRLSEIIQTTPNNFVTLTIWRGEKLHMLTSPIPIVTRERPKYEC